MTTFAGQGKKFAGRGMTFGGHGMTFGAGAQVNIWRIHDDIRWTRDEILGIGNGMQDDICGTQNIATFTGHGMASAECRRHSPDVGLNSPDAG